MIRKEVIGRCELYLDDCMNIIRDKPDGFWDLAVVDPPYGMINHHQNNKQMKCTKRYSYGTKEKMEKWDKAPDEKYFTELFRVSKYQIIWGGNYYVLPPKRNFIIYYKANIPEGFNMAACEYAWTNIDGNASIFRYFSKPDAGRFHPTQKPVALYKWLLSRYAQPGWKLLDTHMGSGSSVIAALDMGYEITAAEIDGDYFDAACDRIRLFAAQKTLDFGGA
ncbi:methyltransferase [Spirochaetia bacterium]|nr:methyltransferase [Spirochaetia bacterium]